MNIFEKILKSTKINFSIENSVEYQIIFEINKQKETQELPNGIWEERILTYTELETKTINLIKKDGYDFKLLFLWFKLHIFSNKISGLIEIFDFLISNFDLINQLNNNQDLYQILDYLDSIVSKAINNIEIEILEFKLKDFSKNRENYIEKIKKLTDNEIGELYKFYLSITEYINSFSKIFKFDLKKTKYTCNFIETIINLYKDYLNNSEVSETVFEQPNAVLQYKKEAFEHIEKALIILNKTDRQNLTIPILEKILKWQHLTLSEILQEFSEDTTMLIAFLKFIAN